MVFDSATTTTVVVFGDRVVHSPSWSISLPVVGVFLLVTVVVVLAIIREAARRRGT